MTLETACQAALQAGGHFQTLGTAADHAAALSNIDRLPLPAAFLIYGDYDDEANQYTGQIIQRRTETLIVRYAVGNQASALGSAAVDAGRAADDAIRAALLGFTPPGYEPMEALGGAHIGYDRGSLWRDAVYIARRYIHATPHY